MQGGQTGNHGGQTKLKTMVDKLKKLKKLKIKKIIQKSLPTLA